MKRWVGGWRGEALTWFDPADPPKPGAWTGEIVPVLGGQFVELRYIGDIVGKPHEGRLTIAFEKDEALWRTAWLDTFHTGTAMLISTGTQAISVKGDYFVKDNPRWGWRTELDDTRDGELLVRMFNVMPGGDESLAVEVTLKRGT